VWIEKLMGGRRTRWRGEAQRKEGRTIEGFSRTLETEGCKDKKDKKGSEVSPKVHFGLSKERRRRGIQLFVHRRQTRTDGKEDEDGKDQGRSIPRRPTQ
jgi:hypothetical protein